jgi:tripartite-type tricarboxylate transporter receptor subunit TctC
MLSTSRRLGLVMLLATAAGLAAAQPFPQRPVRVIAPFPPGGTSDVTLRILAERMKAELGQPVVVENKPGAGGSIANDAAARSPADGYTLLYAGSSYTMLPAIAKVPYDPARAFFPVSQVMDLAAFLIVRADHPARSVGELVSHLKSHAGKVNYASVGVGSVTHFQAEQFKAITGVDMQHVPYKGTGAAMADMLSGEVQVMFDSIATSGPYLRNGQLRALAVALPKRSPALPDVPTMAEAGVAGHDAVAWAGLLAPAATPRPVIDGLNAAVRTALADPEVQAKIRAVGAEVHPSTPEEMDQRLQRELAKWGQMARALGIRPE